VFNRAEQFALYAELYAGGRAPARATRLDVSLEAPDGRALALASESRAVVQKGRQALTQTYTIRPSLRDAPPGRYVLRVDGSIDGAGSPAVTRGDPYRSELSRASFDAAPVARKTTV
jgi:hypothetical protein